MTYLRSAATTTSETVRPSDAALALAASHSSSSTRTERGGVWVSRISRLPDALAHQRGKHHANGTTIITLRGCRAPVTLGGMREVPITPGTAS